MVRETKFYDLLKVSPTASDSEVKKAFRNIAKTAHPDKGGDETHFKQITKAYEALSDPEKRAAYDRYGEEGLEEGGGGGFSHDDLLSSLFGGGGGRGGGRSRGPQKGEDVVHGIAVTLENLYNGRDTKLAVTKKALCSSCSGSGSKKTKSSTTCQGCKGRGVKLITRQFGMMIQQMQATCQDCGGEGSIIPDGDKCDKCRGQKVVQEKKTLELHIDRGMRHNQRITFTGEADQAPDMIPGDIVFVLQLKEHDTFLRKGDDLLITQKIQLVESLCGTRIAITHLDGRVLSVRTPPGHIIKPGDVMCVPGEGMPIYRNPFEKGRLFIKFEVTFPATLSEADAAAVEKVLPARPKLRLPAECEEATLVPADLGQMGASASSHSRHAHDSDDEDSGHGHGHGGGVQCAQQ